MRFLNKKIFNNTISIVLSALSIITFNSCKKFVDVGAPETRANAENIYTSDATAIAVLTGMYSNIMRGTPSPNFASGTNSFSMLCGLSADEYQLFGGANATLSAFYKNALYVQSTASQGADYWNVLYDYLYFTNSAIEGLTKSNGGLTTQVRSQLLGEAKFMRAFFYFYLVNLYDDVPLVTTTDYTLNAVMARVAKDDVYQQMITDLKESEELLSAEYLDGNLQKYASTPERIRPTKWAAQALLARVYLYKKDFTNAEINATSVISNSTFSLVSLNDAFKKNSQEAIWQLQPVTTGRNTDDARAFVIPSSGFSNNNPVRLSNDLLNSFEANDKRKDSGNWVSKITISGNTQYFPFKYKISAQNNSVTSPAAMSEYLMVLRIAEQYLIRAEARAKLSNINGSKTDLDAVRSRAGLPGTSATNETSLLAAILKERQTELFSEWGHRWFDLKRTGSVDAVMGVVTPTKANGSAWQSYQQYYPIPFSDLQRNLNLVQTPGY